MIDPLMQPFHQLAIVSMTPRFPQVKEQLRLAAMVLALLTGALLITGLWQHTLVRTAYCQRAAVRSSFARAGPDGHTPPECGPHGTPMQCGGDRLVSVGTTTGLTDWLEMLMLVMCVSVLLLPTTHGPEQPET